MAGNNFQLSLSSARDANDLPTEFEFLRLLGAGSFGKVVKCLKKDTNQTVAVKIPLARQDNSTEVSVMEKLMCMKLDHSNIVQFFGWFDTRFGKAMVFETLDISLQEFLMKTRFAPMLLSHVSTIIQQLATAFDSLKSIGMIHTDLKLDNIMIVDHERQPLRVKLIDFGLAMHRSKARQGTTMQVANYRALEIMLGLPFSEAIDIWSLGCVMFAMIQGRELFPGDTEYEALNDITAILGLPEDHQVKNGLKAGKYFTKSESNTWRLKTHQEYWREFANTQPQYKTKVCYSMDNLRKLRLEKRNILEAAHRSQCIDLLEAMLRFDQAKRITPLEILKHPFMTCGQYSSNSNRDRFGLKKQGTTQESTNLRAGVTLVRPADTTNMVLLNIEEEISEEPSAALNEDNNVKADRRSPSPASLPPGVILVRPAKAENTLQLEDEETAVILTAGMNKTYSVKEAGRDTAVRTTDGAQTLKVEQKKKRKNCFRRLFSWAKKTFCPGCTATVGPA